MKAFLLAVAVTLISSDAFPQIPDPVATETGNEVSASVGGYRYVEPGTLSIAIHGPKFGGEYTGTMLLDQRRHWFAKANVRGTLGHVTYDGWCSPFFIKPNSGSPNGYELDIGDASSCSDSDNKDWYLEARALFGKDFTAQKWGLSPETGLGFRHLSNGLIDVGGYRTDNYLYLPLGFTARTTVASHAISFNVEYDRLLRGWQKTRDSELGGGDIPATTTAPAFTINGFTDVSFTQHGGWALRAGGKYQVTRRWSVAPSWIHWNVSASPVNYETVTFTVRNIPAHEQMGFYEPQNTTNEFVIKLGFHF